MSERLDAERVRDRDQRRWAAGRANLLRRMVNAGRRRVAMGEFAPANVFAMLLFAVLAIVLFLALVGGTTAYRLIVDDDQAARDMRMGTALVANMVRAVDSSGVVTVGEGPEGPVLVLREQLDSGTFETRLYLYDGWIVEEYAVEGAAYNPDGAMQMAPSKTFSFEVQPTMVRIFCDEGETVVALRADGAVTETALQAEGLDGATQVAGIGQGDGAAQGGGASQSGEAAQAGDAAQSGDASQPGDAAEGGE